MFKAENGRVGVGKGGGGERRTALLEGCTVAEAIKTNPQLTWLEDKENENK